MGKAKYIGNNKDVDLSKQVCYAIWIHEEETDLDYIYTGSGTYSRCNGNMSKLRRNVHETPKLQDAYNRNNNARVELLAYNLDTDEEARQIEQEYIEHFKKVDGVIICNVRNSNNGCTSEAYNKHNRLTEDKVREIKAYIIEGKSNAELSEMFYCSYNTISKIRTGKRWKDVVVC